VAAARAWQRFTSWKLNVDPVVGLDVKDSDFVCPCTLTKATKNHHLAFILFDNSSVFISVRDSITSCLNLGPAHRLEVEVVQLSNVGGLIGFEFLFAIVVATKQIHVVLVDN
jgi:hypothetical protein